MKEKTEGFPAFFRSSAVQPQARIPIYPSKESQAGGRKSNEMVQGDQIQCWAAWISFGSSTNWVQKNLWVYNNAKKK